MPTCFYFGTCQKKKENTDWLTNLLICSLPQFFEDKEIKTNFIPHFCFPLSAKDPNAPRLSFFCSRAWLWFNSLERLDSLHGLYIASFVVQYDSNPNQILEDDRLDMQSFPALSQKDMLRLIGVSPNLYFLYQYVSGTD